MKVEYTYHKRTFEHYMLEGSHYEIGNMQGEIIKKNKEAVKMYTSGKFNPDKSLFSNFEEVHSFYDQLCPGLSDEAQGFADKLDVDVEKLFFYDFSAQRNCSQLLILPPITGKGEILAGRSYEWNFMDEDLQLRTTKVDGKYRHLGFSGMVYGRYEGMNEKGLCVTVSSGGAWSAPQKNKGLNWALAVRVLLDNCKNVKEASETLQRIPVESTNIFILSDKTGVATYLECLDCEYEIKEYTEESSKHYLIGTNHYTLPSKIEYNKYNNPWLLPNSKQRYDIIEKAIEENKPKLNQETVRTLLSNEFPKGICCHWQTDFFGTLWQIIFNVTKGKILVSFGPSTHNDWHEFSIDDPVEKNEYEVSIPDKRIEM